MRIRKHARLSAPPLVSPSPIALDEPDTRVCLLNRSPWDDDVIACTAQSEHEYQVYMNDDNFTCDNTVGSESAHAPNRTFASLEEQWEDAENKVKEEQVGREEEEERILPVRERVKKKPKLKREFDYLRCAKSDGKGWQCKKEAKPGELLCEHHLIQLQSYHHKYSAGANSSQKSTPVKRSAAKAVAGKKRINRGRVSTSPNDFYFYSGFGPSWGRKRGGNEINKEELEVADAIDQLSSPAQVAVVHHHHDPGQASSSSHGHVSRAHVDDNVYDDFDDLYDSDEDEEEGVNGDKKRIRRPIKARSLKSLL